MDKLLKNVLSCMRTKGLLDENEEDVYRFGLECLLLEVVHYLSYIVIGFAMRMIMPMIVTAGAYDEYQRISRESSNSDRQLNTLKYLTNWYSNAVTKNPHMVEKYEAKSDEYIEKNVKNQKVDSIFSDLKTESKSAFIESLKAFQAQNPNFLSNIVNKELSRKYWAYGIIA